MNRKEALEWIQGKQSYRNVVAAAGFARGERMLLEAQLDAAACQQAYWVLKAHAEDLGGDAGRDRCVCGHLVANHIKNGCPHVDCRCEVPNP